ncbi:hypothetical protein [Moorena sp. SIO3I6]|uniref:hypothetical protein n=1 Tax=Moorena sp. SIO3I6 TaxID=2607831 RepID=UPI0013FA8B64|nr:hypothetical protein [Moorena sp. SIO3I6]NEP26971.1 hypothetical protein [Moorena sp. SIO3I6]
MNTFTLTQTSRDRISNFRKTNPTFAKWKIGCAPKDVIEDQCRTTLTEVYSTWIDNCGQEHDVPFAYEFVL